MVQGIGIGVQLVRPLDQLALADAAVNGDTRARGLLVLVHLTVTEVRTVSKGIACASCDRLIGPRAIGRAAHLFAWREHDPAVWRSVVCRSCSEAVDDADLRQGAADQLNGELNRAFAQSRGSTFSLTAGSA